MVPSVWAGCAKYRKMNRIEKPAASKRKPQAHPDI
jgi:hypothetical protein